jgi:hypothetical protein
VQYVTVLPNCVGIRVGEVDICTKGDISFFAVEDFPDHNATPPSINGGLAAPNPAGKNSNAIRGGLLPSSFQVSLATHQLGWDIGVFLGIYTGGNNANVGLLNANNGGAPFGLGTAGIDFRQFFGTIGTPSFGTVKIGRDIGLFGSDAILNDLSLFGVGSVGGNFAPGDTTLGRIGVGYIYADFIPQITYKSPTIAGFTGYVSVMTPLAPLAAGGFGVGDPTSATSCLSGFTLAAGNCNGWTNSDAPMVQGKLSYVSPLPWLTPDAKLTLSTSGLWERVQADCSTQATLPINGRCFFGATPDADDFVNLNGVPLNPNAKVDAWAVDGFAMLDLWGWNFVAYGYTGKGVGSEGLFFNGIDVIGGARRSDGGYLQAAYTFKGGVFFLPNDLTVGASWGISHLETADANDNFVVFSNCGQFGATGNTINPNGATFAAGGQSCLFKDNSSWIGFARYQLTKWVKLQAEYSATTSENQIGQEIHDKAFAVGTTFFW